MKIQGREEMVDQVVAVVVMGVTLEVLLQPVKVITVDRVVLDQVLAVVVAVVLVLPVVIILALRVAVVDQVQPQALLVLP
jgi:divalent metal cation (Fe/Co/Zn/Cd) transporter